MSIYLIIFTVSFYRCSVFFQNLVHFLYVLTCSVVSLMFMENGKVFISLTPLSPVILPDEINISCVYCVPFARFSDQCNYSHLCGKPQQISLLPASKI